MKVATWNVNSVGVRLPRLEEFLRSEAPDIVALQEIKTEEHKFPREALERLGYSLLLSGQKTYNGVAILTKIPPLHWERVNLVALTQPEARCLVAEFPDFTLINVYVPNGQEVGHMKYDYKLQWLGNLRVLAQERLLKGEVLLAGDFNVTPQDRDVHDPELWRERILCSTPERQRLRELLAVGFEDLFRLHNPEHGHYSWWDYRGLGFVKNHGLRIDLLLGSAGIARKCTKVVHFRDYRKGTKPSDHVPVMAYLSSLE